MILLFTLIIVTISFSLGVFVTSIHYKNVIENIDDSILDLDDYIEEGFTSNWEGYSRADYLDRLEKVYYNMEGA